MRKLTTLEFTNRATVIHNGKYDYTPSHYVGAFGVIDIICPVHGLFRQTASSHLGGNGCKECASALRSITYTYTNEKFIEEARQTHGDRYDYRLVDYKHSSIKVQIVCKIHGVFEQVPSHHIQGSGCPRCGMELSLLAAERRKLTNDEFIQSAIGVHGDRYDYSHTNYSSMKSKVTIGCSEHGNFTQLASVHLAGGGCFQCGLKIVGKSTLSNTAEFIMKSNKVHGDRYDYRLVDYKHSHSKVDVICPEHGVFRVTPGKHLEGVGCKFCKSSKGEKALMRVFDKNHIKYIAEYTVPNQSFKHRYDFYLPDKNILIEFHGRQHYEPCGYFGGDSGFTSTILRDDRKATLAKLMGIRLLHFNYTHLKLNPEEFENFAMEYINHPLVLSL